MEKFYLQIHFDTDLIEMLHIVTAPAALAMMGRMSFATPAYSLLKHLRPFLHF
jgi:hypothetical protein